MSYTTGVPGTEQVEGAAYTVVRTSDYAPVAAPTVALNVDVTVLQVDAGTHVYALVPRTALGERMVGSTSATLTNDAAHTSNLITVPALAGDITSYSIYRTKAGVTVPTIAQWFLVAASQAPGVYTDIIADGSLPATNPTQTTLQNDDTLLFAVVANATYFFELFTVTNSVNTAMDIKFGWSVPASTTMQWGVMNTMNTGGFTNQNTASTPLAVLTESSTQAVGTNNVSFGSSFGGLVFAAGTAGNVVLQWAQNTADAGVLKLLKGSFLRVTRLV